MALDYVPPQHATSDPIQRHRAPAAAYPAAAYPAAAYPAAAYPAAAYPAAAPNTRHPNPSPVVVRRSKAEALQLVQRVKRVISVGALLGFGMCSIVVGHQLSTAHVATTATSTSTPNSATEQPSDNGGFFTQQPGGSGVGNSGSQAPVTGSNVS